MLYVFHDCALDMRLYALHRAGEIIPLGPKAFSALVYLIQHRDRVITRQEFCNRLWSGQLIGEATLARCIASLRKAVGDTGNGQQIIKTFYGHGYRFVAEVDECPLTRSARAIPAVSPTLSQRHGQALHHAATSPGSPRHAQDQDSPPQDEPGPLPTVATPLPRHHNGSSALDGEVRQVTVLCGAIAHTTALAARLTPDTLHCLVHSFFEHVLGAVQCHSGFIQTFLDDSFLALFGVPAPCADHARQALQAAMRLRSRLHTPGAARSAASDEPVMVRLGMHTGAVVGRQIGDDRRRTYTAVGDTMRLAIRLQQLAEPDTLLLSDATARHVQGIVEVGACGPMHVSLAQPEGQQSRRTYAVKDQKL